MAGISRSRLLFFFIPLLMLCDQVWGQCAVSLLSKTDIDCFGAHTGAASVTGAGATPFQYAWSSGGSGPFKSGLAAGIHVVTMTDDNNCMDSLTFELSQPDSFGLAPILVSPTCAGDSNGAIWLDIFGGTSYASMGSDSLDVGSFSGVYMGNFTRGFYFKAPVSFRIRTLRVPSDIGTDPQSIQVLRFNGSPNPSPTPFITLFDTSNVAGTAPIQVDIPIQAGDEIGILGGRGNAATLKCSYGSLGYLTSIAGFPVQMERIYYQGNIAATPAPSGTVGTQIGGVLARIEMTFDLQHYTYQWANLGTSRSQTNLSAGTYSVTVSDSLNCLLAETIILSQPDSISIDSAIITSIACADDTAGGAIQLFLSGGTPAVDTISYRIDTTGTFAPMNGNFTPVLLADDQLISNLPIGFNFQFFGQSHSTFNLSSNGFISFSGISHGCCAGQMLPTPIFPNDLIAFAWEDLSPNLGGNVGYLLAGTAPNRRLVVDFDSVPHQGNLANLVSTQVILYETSNRIEVHTRQMDSDGGPHTLGIENANGTKATVHPGRNGNGNWSLTNDYIAFLPTAAYAYSWSNGDNGAQISGLNSGNYSVTISDSLGCGLVQTFQVGVQNVVTANLLLTDITCNGAGDGTALAQVSNGQPPLVYQWSNGDTVASLVGLEAQTMYFNIVDALGCTAISDTLNIWEPDSLQLTASATDARCEFDQNGQAIAQVSGGVGNYAYQWDDPGQQMTDTAYALSAGNYTIIVQDSNLCADTTNITINFQLTAPIVNFPNLDTLCLGQPSFSLTNASPSGGIYSGTGVSTGQFNTTTAGPGVHFLTYAYTDANGCTGTDTSYVNIKICANLPTIPAQDWKIYPNPAKDFLQWEGTVVAFEEKLAIQVFDLMGKSHYQKTQQVNGSGVQQLPIMLPDLPRGVYLLQVKSANTCWTQKIILY